MKILFAAGGTAGHINPAVSVAKYIKERYPECEIRFVGTKEGLESKLVPREGFPIDYIDARGFLRKLSLYNLGSLRRMFTSPKEAARILKAFGPDVVLGTGGYVAWPVLLSANRAGIPCALHEPNAFPGAAVRALQKRADVILLSFDESRKHLKKAGKTVLVGNPVKEDLIFAKKSEARKKLGFDDRPVLLSFGGSLGSKKLNLDILDFMAETKEDDRFYHVHATGDRGYLWFPDKMREKGLVLRDAGRVRVVPYLFNMPEMMAASDLVICRSGAGTLSELACQGKPAILIPSPNVTDNHQEKNALAYGKSGGAVVLTENKIRPGKLRELVFSILFDPKRLQEMAEGARSNAIFDSNQKIYEVLMSLIKEGKI